MSSRVLKIMHTSLDHFLKFSILTRGIQNASGLAVIWLIGSLFGNLHGCYRILLVVGGIVLSSERCTSGFNHQGTILVERQKSVIIAIFLGQDQSFVMLLLRLLLMIVLLSLLLSPVVDYLSIVEGILRREDHSFDGRGVEFP
jgi:hypothetical protein